MASFRPPHPVAALATTAAVAACIALGCWQLERARQKEALIGEFRRGAAAAVDVTARPLGGLARYQAVSARGAYESRRQILLDNMPSAGGRPGYRVLTPFRRTSGGALLLVDRGWLPLGDSRDRLPAVDVPGGVREIAGRIDRPPAPGLRMRSTAAGDGARWPRLMNFPTADELAAALGEPVEAHLVLLDARAPDGYERNWRPELRMNPARHRAYAVQWFAFALLAVAALVITAMRRDARKDGAGA